MTEDLTGNEKQVKWAQQIRDKMLAEIERFITEEQLAEIQKVTKASWWIDIRMYPINEESIVDLVGAAWLINHGITELSSASGNKVRQALRNEGKLEPLQHGFGTMCGTYNHVLTLKNGNRFVVSESVAKSTIY